MPACVIVYLFKQNPNTEESTIPKSIIRLNTTVIMSSAGGKFNLKSQSQVIVMV